MGIIEELSSLRSDVDTLRRSLGRHQRVPEVRWGTVTALTPAIRVGWPEGGDCVITQVAAPIVVGSWVSVQVQGRDRWITGVKDDPTIPARPLGEVFYAESGTLGQTTLPGWDPGLGFGEISFTPQAGRKYKLTLHPPMCYAAAVPAGAQTDIKLTTDGSQPHNTSTSVKMTQWQISVVTTFQQPPDMTYEWTVSSTPANPYRFLCTMGYTNGGTPVYARIDALRGNLWWRIEDMGLASATSGNTITSNAG